MANKKFSWFYIQMLLLFLMIMFALYKAIGPLRPESLHSPSIYTVVHKTCSGRLEKTYEGCSKIKRYGNGLMITKSDGLTTIILGGLTIINEEGMFLNDPNITVKEE